MNGKVGDKRTSDSTADCTFNAGKLPLATHADILNPMTRRQLLALPSLAIAGLNWPVSGQQFRGMASRGVTPAPRGKPSGLPFNAKFVNVAREAGLTAPVIYGDEGRADY